MYVAPFSWAGLYVGVNGGYGRGTSDWSSAATVGNADPRAPWSGGTLGYNLQTCVWAWGIEGDFDSSWVKGSDATGVCADAGCETNNTWFATARPHRLCLGPVPALRRRRRRFWQHQDDAASGASDSATGVGWTVGAGLEYAFLGN
jgi:outer membrane immunogenic protein